MARRIVPSRIVSLGVLAALTFNLAILLGSAFFWQGNRVLFGHLRWSLASPNREHTHREALVTGESPPSTEESAPLRLHIASLEAENKRLKAQLSSVSEYPQEHAAAADPQYGLQDPADPQHALADDSHDTAASFATSPELDLPTSTVSAHKKLRISVAVIAIAYDLDSVTPISGLLNSIARQTVPPYEVLVVMSGVGEEGCRRMRTIMAETVSAHTRTAVECSEQLLNRHAARNRVLQFVTGDVVSFMDADDEMHVQKVEITALLFEQDAELQAMAHTWADGKAVLDQRLAVESAKRHYRHEMARLAETAHKGQWVAKRMVHGAVSVRFVTAKKVPWRCWVQDNECADRAEDPRYIRDLLDFLKEDRQFLYIFLPLIWYKPKIMKQFGLEWGGKHSKSKLGG